MAWKYFVLGRDKSPLPNCPPCRDAGPEHNREACACLTCHAIYAATDDRARLNAMAKLYPGHAWAVRTGEASDIIVLDAEGDGDPSGVAVLDAFETWTNGIALPHTDRIAATPSGGVHRYYRYRPGIRSRNRVLPGVDLKADGGYVVIPRTTHYPVEGRTWLADGEPGDIPEDFYRWLTTVRGQTSGGGVTGHTHGYDYERFLREGCPGGMRDEFFNELIFRLRKAGVDRHIATLQIREHWQKVKQPPDAKWYMPWHHIEYKIERIWKTVEPEALTPTEQAWLKIVTAPAGSRSDSRVTLVGRGGA